MSEDELRDLLAPGEPGDDLLLRIVAALRSDGASISIEDAGGLGADQALIVAAVDGHRMRITAQPWS